MTAPDHTLAARLAAIKHSDMRMEVLEDAYRSGQLITLSEHQSLMGELVKSMDASLETGLKAIQETIMDSHTAAVQAAVANAVEAEREAAKLLVWTLCHQIKGSMLVDEDHEQAVLDMVKETAAAIRARKGDVL